MTRAHVAVISAAVLAGIALGLGGYTFAYARGWSYLTDDPEACANCHVMNGQHDAWIKGSHRSVATCNDCHVPGGFLGKWYVKARNGFWHSYYFTSGKFPEPIHATPTSRAVVEGNCRRCHEAVVHAIGADGISCIRCHASAGHMELGATSVAAAWR